MVTEMERSTTANTPLRPANWGLLCRTDGGGGSKDNHKHIWDKLSKRWVPAKRATSGYGTNAKMGWTEARPKASPCIGPVKFRDLRKCLGGINDAIMEDLLKIFFRVFGQSDFGSVLWVTDRRGPFWGATSDSAYIPLAGHLITSSYSKHSDKVPDYGGKLSASGDDYED
ncbi:hypothetical protein K438DRAFT_1768137 [Mycena galopus ATCC 62051]|nr:hypothetical protein K438DRAFT_1768137 [Mycena galopus ATCC 62051]